MPKIKIITGSVRPNRFNDQPSNWIYDIATKRKDAEYELVNLAEMNLPFLDEPKSPKAREYTKDNTKAWSEKVEASDGFLFVTPEYNHSVSPALKNALDFLYYEWNHKPASFISYGAEAGGARSVEHLRAVCGELKMYDLREQLILPNYWENQNESGEYQFNEKHEEAANRILDELVFWSTEMKSAREKMTVAVKK
ncbi:MAG: NAD(P)H-dependent oxidoreductase [Candidatus Dojkabacteria bacterium]|nr:MAG: NAD(P)H-dependent oxidoreductase [Candidatus Dojkabacteria bacterium]